MSELMSVQEPDDSNEEFITLSEGSFSLQSYNRKQVILTAYTNCLREQYQRILTDVKVYVTEIQYSSILY